MNMKGSAIELVVWLGAWLITYIIYERKHYITLYMKEYSADISLAGMLPFCV